MPPSHSSLNAGRAAFGECLDFGQSGHGDVAGECGQKGAMGPAEPEGVFGRSAREQAVDQAGGEAVAAADAVEDVELAHRADVSLAVEPEHGGPVVPVGRMHLAQGRRHELDVGMLLDRRGRSATKKVSGSRLDLPATSGPGMPRPFLKVFFVSDQRIEMADDVLDDLLAVLGAADGCPELGAVVEVERGDGAGTPWRPAFPR